MCVSYCIFLTVTSQLVSIFPGFFSCTILWIGLCKYIIVTCFLFRMNVDMYGELKLVIRWPIQQFPCDTALDTVDDVTTDHFCHTHTVQFRTISAQSPAWHRHDKPTWLCTLFVVGFGHYMGWRNTILCEIMFLFSKFPLPLFPYPFLILLWYLVCHTQWRLLCSTTCTY